VLAAVRRCRLLPALLCILAVAACGDDGGSDRQQAIAERGATVMPFDLEVTTHRFTPLADGLEQTVVSDDPADLEQVALVRQHLAAEAARFRAGDFADPAAIHGEDMPGLADLRNGAAEIDVTFDEIDAGGRIRFATDDPQLVAALHAWGEAQVMDHGAHAEHGGA
jgi:hypothetical protein